MRGRHSHDSREKEIERERESREKRKRGRTTMDGVIYNGWPDRSSSRLPSLIRGGSFGYLWPRSCQQRGVWTMAGEGLLRSSRRALRFDAAKGGKGWRFQGEVAAEADSLYVRLFLPVCVRACTCGVWVVCTRKRARKRAHVRWTNERNERTER